MVKNEKIQLADLGSLRIIHYPDPRLMEVCTPVDEVDDSVRDLAERMFELMLDAGGVGLAAPQVGLTVRLFVASPGPEAQDRRVYVNPSIIAAEGAQHEEEGCLSLPGITCHIRRSKVVTIRATNPDGEVFEETGEDLAARAFQHELDHLDGRLLIHRMATVARMANRRRVKELEREFRQA